VLTKANLLLDEIVALIPEKTTTTTTSRAEVKRWRPPVRRVSIDRDALPAVFESRLTVKADAGERLFQADCSDVTWAVVDTGIDATHAAFQTEGRNRVLKKYDVYRGLAAMPQIAKEGQFLISIVDDNEWEHFERSANVALDTETKYINGANHHGTHIAGIIGGSFKDASGLAIEGICTSVRLVDVRVFDEQGNSSEKVVFVALQFVRWLHRKRHIASRRIDGVNLSLSVPFIVDNSACGWTPVCREADGLVRDGVVVVAAAGNSGIDETTNQTNGAGFWSMSISDPGNTERVITVGSTDTTEPHRYGPAGRSAKGPTADGRHKPDLLAPGIRIEAPIPGGLTDTMSGTSQAAAHVSGAAAMLLGRFVELRGQPDAVKRLLCEGATDLGRLRDFQGHGLLDILRTLQLH
jgi:subtilisin family serine protease